MRVNFVNAGKEEVSTAVSVFYNPFRREENHVTISVNHVTISVNHVTISVNHALSISMIAYLKNESVTNKYLRNIM